MLKTTSTIMMFLLCLLTGVGSIQAQANVQLSRLAIELWPEYDRPETLVIYRGALAETTPLPAKVTFLLPAHVDDLNAMAVVNEQNSLVNNPYTLNQAGEFARLDFTLEVRQFQFEYYDPAILSKEGTSRQLVFATQAPYATTDLLVEVLEPPTASDISFSPTATDRFVGDNQLTYHIFRQGVVGSGQAIAVAGGYQKQTDSLVIDQLTSGRPAEFSPPAPVADPPPTISPGYWLIIGGALLVLFSLGWWLFGNRRRLVAAGPAAGGRAKASYCHHCGAAYQNEARFCHQCGSPRR